jgi:hypothetical protein
VDLAHVGVDRDRVLLEGGVQEPAVPLVGLAYLLERRVRLAAGKFGCEDSVLIGSPLAGGLSCPSASPQRLVRIRASLSAAVRSLFVVLRRVCSCAAMPGSQIEHQVAVGLGAADQRASLSGIIDRVRGVADRTGYQVRFTGVAYAGAA